MGSKNFSLPEYAERYEYVRFSPDQAFRVPDVNAIQIKNGHTWTNQRSYWYL